MISEATTDALRAILGNDWYLDAPEDIVTYSYDGFLPEFTPDAVLVPESAAQIAQIMKIANKYKINIIPRGAGTNICGSSVAREGGAIMAFHRMNKILEIDRDSRCAVVQTGVVNRDLQKKCLGSKKKVIARVLGKKGTLRAIYHGSSGGWAPLFI